MELRHLRYFVAVAEAENVSRAALKLHLSQPPLSRQIRDLEDELGFMLFERTAKSVRLTDAGFLFLKEARAVLERTDEAVRKVRVFAQTGETELHVAYAPFLRAQIVSPALHAFQQAMPRVHVKLHDPTTAEKALTGLRDGRWQLLFIGRPPKHSAFHDLRFEELFRQQVRLGVPPGHPFVQRRSVSLTDAAKELFVGLTREDFPEYNAYVSAVFAQAKSKPRVIEEFDNMMGLISAIEAGTGVAMVVDLLVQSFGSRVKLVRLTPELKPISFGIVARKGRLSPAAEKFWQCAKEVSAAK
ncbi:MAG: LysR family transcriptional regulator [Verrucomicrobia bacterium]|nr:LysR family transcriptional regulator [Verrucomicrobiota bacterium]